jgi:cytochrome c556
MRSIHLALAASTAVLIASCGPPVMNTPVEQIPNLTTLAEVMDNQATTADPQFKKIGEASYTDEDYKAFATASARLKVTSLKIKDFSKGPEFDALAMRLNEKAAALGTAAEKKDAAASSEALKEMKATCKECHSKFR